MNGIGSGLGSIRSKFARAASLVCMGGQVAPAADATEKLPRGRLNSNAVASVVDLFCGVGGLSHGFVEEGFAVSCGIDVDERCRFPFEANNAARFVRRDISTLSGVEVSRAFTPNLPTVLVGCAPCQPFSLYTQARDNPQWKLLAEFARLIEEVRPDVVSMENVPRLLQFRGGAVFRAFQRRLEGAGFQIWSQQVYCPDYGVPQSRSRLVLLASRHGRLRLEPPATLFGKHSTVADAIGGLPSLKAGAADQRDPLHVASALSEINLRRVRASRPGGTWRDWPEDLRAECHQRSSGRGYGSVYGRMRWDETAPTITTQFYGFGSGRFGHPEQDRALSLREGALLQTFPREYRFLAPGTEVEIAPLGRLIGNAVPVELARAIARSIHQHLQEVADRKARRRGLRVDERELERI